MGRGEGGGEGEEGGCWLRGLLDLMVYGGGDGGRTEIGVPGLE